MNKKKIFRSFIGLTATTMLSFSSICFITSCSKDNDRPAELFVPESTTTHQISIPVQFWMQPKSELKVKLIGNVPAELQLPTSSFIVVEQKTTIFIDINNELTETKTFSYQLEIEYTDFFGIPKTRQFNNCVTTFIYSEPPVEEDKLIPDYSTVQRFNQHDFDFKLRYYTGDEEVQPVEDTPFNLTMYNSDERLSFEGQADPHKITCKLEKETATKYYVNFTVHLNQTVTDTNSFYFNLSLEFINSYGVEQTVNLKDLIVTFVNARENVVPVEYLKIVEDTAKPGTGTIVGLTDDAPETEAGQYTTLDIPETIDVPDGSGGMKPIEVLSIGPKAFSGGVEETGTYDKEWFKNVNKVIFNKNLEHLDESAFDECKLIYYIDISSYEPTKIDVDPFPAWIPDITSPEPTPISPFKNTKFKTGYFVVSKLSDKDQSYEYKSFLALKALKALSLNPELENNYYVGCNNEEMSTQNFFEYDNTGTKILGLKDSLKKETLENCRIILIPEFVTAIEDFALTQFGDTPCVNDNPNYPVYTTRRLIFNPKIVDVGVQHNIGIGGPLIFNMPDLTEIQDYAFQNANLYSISASQTHNISYENISLGFVNSDKLTTIGKSAFIDVPFRLWSYPDKTFELPDSVTTIGDYAFRGNEFGSIVLPSNLASLGSKAFAQIDSKYKESGPLTKIDFHNIPAKKLINAIQSSIRIFDWTFSRSTIISLISDGKLSDEQKRSVVDAFGLVTNIHRWEWI